MALEELDQDVSIDFSEKRGVKTSRQELLTNAKTEPIVQGFYPCPEPLLSFDQPELPAKKPNSYLERNERKKSFNQAQLLGVRHFCLTKPVQENLRTLTVGVFIQKISMITLNLA